MAYIRVCVNLPNTDGNVNQYIADQVGYSFVLQLQIRRDDHHFVARFTSEFKDRILHGFSMGVCCIGFFPNTNFEAQN